MAATLLVGAQPMLARIFQNEDLNFLLTNRIPRRWATLFMGWFSRIESRWLTRTSLRVWRLFSPDLDLAEARRTDFESLQACFIRELKEGARPVADDPDQLVSPCDAIIGASGRIEDDQVFQAKGFPYRLHDLLEDDELVAQHRGGFYVTLRLTSTMYHRFHAPTDCRVSRVTYISGDTWNVNPIALKRVEKLFCRNERAVLRLEVDDPRLRVTLVPVAAILVASLKLYCLDETLSLRYAGPERIPCSARYARGEEMGYFQHGSTIIVFVSGPVELAEGLEEGQRIRMGEPLLRRTEIEEPALLGAGKSDSRVS